MADNTFHPILEMRLLVEASFSNIVFGDEMLQWRTLALHVERISLVRYLEQQNSARPQHVVPMTQRCQRKRQMLQHMAGDHEVQTGRQKWQAGGVRHYVRRNNRLGH